MEQMTNEKENRRISKFLSFVLRHNPGHIGLELDSNGWADVDLLIQQCNKSNIPLTPDLLKHIVETNSKKRFAFNEQQNKIRASQGHSIDVELELAQMEPPAILYHGTAVQFVSSIMEQGLIKQQRLHVHLSPDVETAINTGGRHGKPFVLEVAALQMFNDGYTFCVSANGVWLTGHVPSKYLKEHKR